MRTITMFMAALLAVGCASAPKKRAETATSPERDVEASEEVDDRTTTAAARAGTTVFEVTEEEVQFQSAGVKLDGTLLRPTGVAKPRAGVVIVHDYGPLGRDGTMKTAFATSLPAEVAVYRTIAEDLAAAGYAVLLYDKRTCVQGAAAWCRYPRTHLDVDDGMGEALLDDAKAAAGFLKSNLSLDLVHWVGHGQGAQIAMVAASSDSNVVLLAPTTRRLDELMQWQTARSIELLDAELAKVGDTPEGDLLLQRKKELAAQAKAQTDGLAELKDGKAKGEILGIDVETWRSYRALHEKFVESLGERGATAIVGTADYDADPDAVAELRAAMEGRGSVVEIDGLTHLMVAIGEEADPTVVSPRVLDVVVGAMD